jgi:hypothetical protein
LFVVYADDTGKLCRLQKGVEFSHYADSDEIAPAQICQCEIVATKTHIRREGTSILVSVVAEATIAVFTQSERTYITACEGAISKIEPIKFYSAIPFAGEGIVEDEFDADSVDDILIPSAQVAVTNCTTRAGEATAEGELLLSVLAMRGDKPVCLERAIAFHVAVPCEEGEDAEAAFCKASLRDLSVNATVREDKGKCTIAVAATLGLAGVSYRVREVPALLDLFATKNEITYEQQTETASVCQGIQVYTERINGACAVKSKLDYACLMKAVALPQVEYAYHAEGKTLEGAVTAQLLYERNGQDLSTEVTLPFSVTVRDSDENCRIQVTVSGVSVRQAAEGQCVAEATLKIVMQVAQNCTVTFVSRVEEGQPIAENANAISVVLPHQGDSLWEIAKDLKQSPEEVMACNPDLHFPLSGTERILIYRQKEKAQ